jgi:hypothetical protein
MRIISDKPIYARRKRSVEELNVVARIRGFAHEIGGAISASSGPSAGNHPMQTRSLGSDHEDKEPTIVR